MSHTLIVLPDDTAKSIHDAITNATRSLDIRMFLFTDPTLLDTVMAATRRGVHVRVMWNPARRSGKSENEESRKTLVATGIEVRDSTPVFALRHQNSMVIDETTGFVESLNWETRDLTETRDYAVVTTHKIDQSLSGELRRASRAGDRHRRASRGASSTAHVPSRLGTLA